MLIAILRFSIYTDILPLFLSSLRFEVWYRYSYLHHKRWNMAPLFFKSLFKSLGYGDNTSVTFTESPSYHLIKRVVLQLPLIYLVLFQVYNFFHF